MCHYGCSIFHGKRTSKQFYLSSPLVFIIVFTFCVFQVSHGAGGTLEGSHNNAALTALRTLANNGLDSVQQDNG